ncbi:MAG: hypothetical protein R3E12_14295 [Candidatus Eisenbacteria bacterium]
MRQCLGGQPFGLVELGQAPMHVRPGAVDAHDFLRDRNGVAVETDRFVRTNRLLVGGQRVVALAHPHQQVAEIDVIVRIGFALGDQVAPLLDRVLDFPVAYEILGLPLGYGAHLRRRSPIP